MERKKIIRDILINLFASSICTAALNMVVYPIYAKRFSAEEYGNILTIIGAVNLLIAVLGNCLNNTRLVLNKDNNCDNEKGNYNLLAIASSVIGAVIGALTISFFSLHSFVSIILGIITLFFGIARAYYIVAFRLKLDYITQLKTNIIVSFGYIFGILVIKKASMWPLPLCLGETVAFFYVIKKSTLIKEPFVFTSDSKRVIFTYGDLIVSGLIGNVIVYFDRFLINPLLGATSVAVFSVAAFWGKAVTPFISPTANVMLSYLSQKESKMSMKKYVSLFLASVIPLFAFGIIGIWLAPIATKILYPSLVDNAIPYMFIASMGSLAQSSTSLLMPVLLSVCSSRTILILQTIYFLLYLCIAFFGATYGGLMGFCISTCIIGIIKAFLFFSFGQHSLRKAGQITF